MLLLKKKNNHFGSFLSTTEEKKLNKSRISQVCNFQKHLFLNSNVIKLYFVFIRVVKKEANLQRLFWHEGVLKRNGLYFYSALLSIRVWNF